jgi:chromosome segregation ATPase
VNGCAIQGIVLSDEIVKLQETDSVANQVDGNSLSGEVIGENKNLTADAVEEISSHSNTHTNHLLKLFDELRSFADQACDAVIREARCADRIEETMAVEIKALQEQIKEKEEFLQARDLVLARFEETTNAKLAELGSSIQDQDRQLKNREIQLQYLASERDFLVGRVRETELATEQAEARARQHTERIEAEFTDLRLQLERREESLAARELALGRQETDLRAAIQNLQLRLQETEAKLASRERELKQKESLIDAAAVRETEIGRFIERLSSECEKLSAELCEKRLLITRLQDKTRHSTNGGKVWKKVLGLAQDEAS